MSGSLQSDLPPPADQDLSICIDPPTFEETQKDIQDKTSNKASGLDCYPVCGEVIANIVNKVCVEVFTSHTPPKQWTTNVTAPLPKKGDISLMTNYVNGCKGVKQDTVVQNDRPC